MLGDCCPVCLSVMLVYCGQTVGWTKDYLRTKWHLDATWYRGSPRPSWHCVRWGPSSPHGKGDSNPPLFGPCLLWPNGRHISATAEIFLCPVWSQCPTLLAVLACWLRWQAFRLQNIRATSLQRCYCETYGERNLGELVDRGSQGKLPLRRIDRPSNVLDFDCHALFAACCSLTIHCTLHRPVTVLRVYVKRCGVFVLHFLRGRPTRKERKEVYLYSAIYCNTLKALRHGSHSFTCK